MKYGEKALHELQIDPEFQSLLPPLTLEESAALEESLVSEGCRDALIIWCGIIIDGHNRYSICKRRGVPFAISAMDFDSREDVIIWMCKNQAGRRNVTPEQMTYLLGKRYEAEKVRQKRNQYTKNASAQNGHQQKTADRIAEEVGVGHNTVRRAADFARAVDKLAEDSPTIKQKILSGGAGQPREKLIEIAKRPENERKEAVRRIEQGEPVQAPPETKACSTCGRELPVERFYFSKGRYSSRCMQCERQEKYQAADAEAVKQNIGNISTATARLYDTEAAIEYTADDAVEEITRGAALFKRMVMNVICIHEELFTKPENRAKLVSALDATISDIDAIRRTQ